MLTTNLSPNSNIEYIQKELLSDCNDDVYPYYLKKAVKHYNELCSLYNLEVRPYQPEMAALYALRANNICAGSCGLGKTFIVGLLICVLYENFKRPGQIQIAVPNPLSGKTRWLCDLNKLTHLKNKIEFINSEGQALKSNRPIWVYTIDFIKRNSKQIGGSRSTIARLLKRRHLTPSLLVIDEVHLLKPDSDRSKTWDWWRRHCKRFLALSGTLSDGRLDLLIHIASLVYRSNLTYSKQDFLSEFQVNTTVTTNYIKGEEPVSKISTRYLPHLDITKLPKYAEFAQQFIHRVSLNDPNVSSVVKIPTYYENELMIMPTIEHREYYHGVFESVKERLESVKNASWTIALNTINPLLRASAFCPPNIRNNKLEKLLQLVANCDGKTVVFVNQIETGRILHNKFKDIYNIDAIRLYAQDQECTPKVLSASKREALVCRFLFDPNVKVGIFSINLAAESIDLNTASQVIFYDYPWQAIKLQQAIFRAVRPGSSVNHIKVHYLYNSGMIDRHQFYLLNERKKSTHTMLDFDPTNLKGQDLSVLDTSELIQRTLTSGSDLFDQLMAGV